MYSIAMKGCPSCSPTSKIGDDVRMLQTGGEPRLADEALADLRLIDAQELQRDEPIDGGISPHPKTTRSRVWAGALLLGLLAAPFGASTYVLGVATEMFITLIAV